MDMVHDSYTSCFTFANISTISNYKDIGIHWYHLCFCCKPVLIHSFLQKGSLEGYCIFAIDDTCWILPCFSCDMLPVLWKWLGAAKWFTHAFSRYILEKVQNATIPCLPKESYAIRRLLCASNDDCAFHYLYKSSHCQTCCWVFQSGGRKGLKWPEKIKQSLTHNFLVGVMKHMNKSCKNNVKWPSFQDSFWKSMHVMWRTWIQHKAVH